MNKNRPITSTNTEQSFDISELFFSTTDEKGRITSCDEVFLKISCFESPELLGAAHNIIRHPDMPRCVFKLLWDYLLEGRAIGAYVKNRAKNGNYYWVFALASPIPGGFISVRIKPSSDIFPVVQGLYAELLVEEESYGEDWRSGMAASTKTLLERLTTLGFSSYDDFMGLALLQEMDAREKALVDVHRTKYAPVAKAYDTLKQTFSHLHELLILKTELLAKERFFSGLGTQMMRVALNASIKAAHLGNAGASLGVISEEVSNISKKIGDESHKLQLLAPELASSLGQLSFFVSQALLQLESVCYFAKEDSQKLLDGEGQRGRYGETSENLSSLLMRNAQESIERTIECIHSVRGSALSFDDSSESLEKILLTIRFSYISGRTLTARIDGGDQFSTLLDEMMVLSEKAQEELYNLKRSVRRLRDNAQKWSLEAVP